MKRRKIKACAALLTASMVVTALPVLKPLESVVESAVGSSEVRADEEDVGGD